MALVSPRAGARDTVFAPLAWYDEVEHRKLLAIAAEAGLEGKLRCLGDITLTASAATTTLSDRRIGPNSFIWFMPTTANAAAEIGAGTLYVTGRTDQSATINHANNAQTDRTFRYIVIG